jgi:hypothetical protein
MRSFGVPECMLSIRPALENHFELGRGMIVINSRGNAGYSWFFLFFSFIFLVFDKKK